MLMNTEYCLCRKKDYMIEMMDDRANIHTQHARSEYADGGAGVG